MPSSFLTSCSMTKRCREAVTKADTYLKMKQLLFLHLTVLFTGVNSPLIELVDDLEVAVAGADHVLVDKVEGGVRDELVQVTVVVLK